MPRLSAGLLRPPSCLSLSISAQGRGGLTASQLSPLHPLCRLPNCPLWKQPPIPFPVPPCLSCWGESKGRPGVAATTGQRDREAMTKPRPPLTEKTIAPDLRLSGDKTRSKARVGGRTRCDVEIRPLFLAGGQTMVTENRGSPKSEVGLNYSCRCCGSAEVDSNRSWWLSRRSFFYLAIFRRRF